ncbi:SH3 domain-containing protein [Streptomyces sp. NPDC002491]
MSLRSALTRLAIVAAAGALASSAAVAPALADGGDGVHAHQGATDGRQNEGGEDGDDWRPGGGDGGGGGWQSGGNGNQWQSGGNQSGNQSTGHQNGGQSGGSQWQSGGNGNQWQSGGNQSGNQSSGHQNGGQSGGSQWQSGGNGNQWQSGGDQAGSDQSGDHDDGRRSRGRVTADELLLRSAPTRASQVIRVAFRGEIVSIFCRTVGQDVQGDTHWYLLTDGTWAWGSARFIETIGAAPRWC